MGTNREKQIINRHTAAKNHLFLALLMLLMAAAAFKAIPADAATTGFVKKGNYTYYIDADGSRHTGWLTLNGKMYCFTRYGTMWTGWLKSSSGALRYFSPQDGHLVTGYQCIDGKYYYLDPARTGIAKTGWLKLKTYYLYFESNGSNASGFKKIGNYWYLFTRKGIAITGYHKIGDYYYGFSSSGKMIRNTFLTIKGYKYYFQASGRVATGWFSVGLKEYYADSYGRLVTTNRKIDGVNTYFNSDGSVSYQGTGLSTSSDCALLIDATANKVYYAKNANVTHANASTTKMMTALLTLENCKLTDVVTASAYAASIEPSKMYMQVGEKFYVKDLLYSLLVPSHNDTAVALAEHIGGSESKFVALMNSRAKELGCTRTQFATPNGLDAGYTHYTTCMDLAKIAKACMASQTFRNIVATKSYSFKSISGIYHSFSTTNSLLASYSDVIGIKTGYTNKAGHCFVGGLMGKNGHLYISVILGGSTSSNRWNDSKTLLDYARRLGA